MNYGTLDELFERMTPAFQRSNGSWAHDMQIRFVENILRGVKTELLFYRFDEVVRFYVEMNEGITHSESDIQNAKDWLFSETGVRL